MSMIDYFYAISSYTVLFVSQEYAAVYICKRSLFMPLA